MATIYEALGISEQRERELMKIAREIICKNPNVSDTIMEILRLENVTMIEKAYMIFMVGQFEGALRTIVTLQRHVEEGVNAVVEMIKEIMGEQ